MAIELFANTMSMFDSSVRKNGHSRCISCRKDMPFSGCALSHAATALPKPNQPGNIRRHCAHENTHGIARRSSIARVFLREAGRLPMFNVAISLMTVEDQKYSTKPSV